MVLQVDRTYFSGTHNMTQSFSFDSLLTISKISWWHLSKTNVLLGQSTDSLTQPPDLPPSHGHEMQSACELRHVPLMQHVLVILLDEV